LIEFVMFAAVLFYAAAASAVLVLRAKMPYASRVYRVWGYPLLPIVYVMINVLVCLALVWERPLTSLIGTAIILTALPAYAFWKRRSSGQRPQTPAEKR
jgi:APA family basic amino acid/polyamine antiporter